MSHTPESAPASPPITDRQLREGLGDVGRAFLDFQSLTDVQRAAIIPIAEGRDTLVCAATASGKTEAIFAPLVWRLRRSPRPAAKGPFLLAVAPTRALVADLVARLETPLSKIEWRCAGQTSDFGGASSAPEVLVTTPESFDSMLVRRRRVAQGQPVGHLLANVAAVFVDEAHCFDNTCRGEQTAFLLARLRKLRATALQKGWIRSAAIQVCAASATIYDPETLAKRLLGSDAVAVVCTGSRPIEVLSASGDWLGLDGSRCAPALASLIPRASQRPQIAELVWRTLEPALCRIRDMGLRLFTDEGLGRFASALPPDVAEAMVTDLAFGQRFSEWCNSRQLPLVTDQTPNSDPGFAPLAALVGVDTTFVSPL